MVSRKRLARYSHILFCQYGPLGCFDDPGSAAVRLLNQAGLVIWAFRAMRAVTGHVRALSSTSDHLSWTFSYKVHICSAVCPGAGILVSAHHHTRSLY